MAKSPVTPATPWVANSIDPFADQAYQDGDRPDLGYDVYLLIGQSNMVGRATIRPGIDDDYTLFAGSAFQFGYNSQTVTAATNPLDQVDESAGDTGLWKGFCESIIDDLAAGRDILFVPAAEGGTGFSGNEWNPDDPNYDGAQARLASAMAEGSGTNRLKGVLWHQGESDTGATGTYQASLQAMYDSMVSEFSGMDANTAFVVGAINASGSSEIAINAASLNFANANTPTKYVDLTDLVWFDGVHMDALSLETAGNRYAGEL